MLVSTRNCGKPVERPYHSNASLGRLAGVRLGINRQEACERVEVCAGRWKFDSSAPGSMSNEYQEKVAQLAAAPLVLTFRCRTYFVPAEARNGRARSAMTFTVPPLTSIVRCQLA